MSKPTRPSLASRLAAAAQTAPSPQAAATTAMMETTLPSTASTETSAAAKTPKARQGKTMIAGYFSPDMARAVKLLAVERGLTVQALIGEGLDLVLRQHQRHPFGER